MKDMLPDYWKAMVRKLAERHATEVSAQEAIYQDVLELLDTCCAEMANYLMANQDNPEAILEEAQELARRIPPDELADAEKRLRAALEAKGAPKERIDQLLSQVMPQKGN